MKFHLNLALLVGLQPHLYAPQPTPHLSATAGHTPYSLTGKSSGACCIRAVDDGQGGSASLTSSSSDVRLELFSSVIEETEAQQTPGATMAAPRTPADSAVAAMRLCSGSAGSSAGARACNSDKEQPDMTKTPAPGTNSAAAGNSSHISFTGFGPSVVQPAEVEEESTPPFFSKTAGHKDATRASNSSRSSCCCEYTSAGGTVESSKCSTHTPAPATAAAAGGVPAAAAEYNSGMSTAELAGAGGCRVADSMLTPKSRLGQPARVPLEGSSRWVT